MLLAPVFARVFFAFVMFFIESLDQEVWYEVFGAVYRLDDPEVLLEYMFLLLRSSQITLK